MRGYALFRCNGRAGAELGTGIASGAGTLKPLVIDKNTVVLTWGFGRRADPKCRGLCKGE